MVNIRSDVTLTQEEVLESYTLSQAKEVRGRNGVPEGGRGCRSVVGAWEG